MSLGITAAPGRRGIWNEMIWTADEAAPFVITEVIGIVEGYRVLDFRDDGGLESILDDAKEMMSRRAAQKGADAIATVRYQIAPGFVFVYGTAVKVRKIS